MFLRFRPSAFLAVTIVLTASFALAAEPPSLIEIHAAWKKRQDAVKSLSVEWTEVYSIREGSPSTHRLEYVHQLDGRMGRYDYKGPSQNALGKYVDTSGWSAMNGVEHRTLQHDSFSSPFDIVSHPTGYYGTGINDSNVRGKGLPLLLHARALDDYYGVDHRSRPSDGPGAPPAATPEIPTVFTVTLREVGKAKLAVIDRRFGHIGHQIWVDPAKDFVVRRYAQMFNDRPVVAYDVTYEKDDKIGWRPKSWAHEVVNYAMDGSRNVYQQSKVTVDKFEVNPKLRKELFLPEFPVGSMIDCMGAPRDRYYVKRDGAKRPIVEEEIKRMASYEEIAATEPGEAGKVRTEEEITRREEILRRLKAR